MSQDAEKSIELFCHKCKDYTWRVLDPADHHRYVCAKCHVSYTLQDSNKALMEALHL